MEMQVEIRIKKCGISNQPDVCIFDDPCLSKFGALRGSCPHPGRQFVGLLCVSLAAPESPPIVSGVSDMHPSDCPNVEETRNPMQTFSRKKCSHFSPTNIPSAFPHEIPKCVSNNITYQSTICLLRQFLFTYRFCSAKNEGRIYISEVILGEWHVSTLSFSIVKYELAYFFACACPGAGCAGRVGTVRKICRFDGCGFRKNSL